MNFKFTKLTAYILLAVSLSTSSCKKIIDEIRKHPGSGVASECRIDKILGDPVNMSGPDGESIFVGDTAQFFYNKDGNPIYIKHSFYKYEQDSYFREVVYKYDAQKRLVANLILHNRDEESGMDRAWRWDVYKYNSDGSITKYRYWDASAPYASVGNEYESIAIEPTVYDDPPETATYTLDEYGRFKTKSSEAGTKVFNYNSSGNLVGATYSNNLSYLQTHKVWMMVTENFSVNEKTSPLEYYSWDDFPVSFNSNKLPVNFSAYPTIGGVPGRAESVNNNAKMIYICK